MCARVGPPVSPASELFYDALYFVFVTRSLGSSQPVAAEPDASTVGAGYASGAAQVYAHVTDVCLASAMPHKHAWSGQ